MEELNFIKCEPGGLSDTEETCDSEQYVLLPTNHMEIKTETHSDYAEPSIEETSVEIVKRELESEVPNLLVPMADDDLAAVKVETHPVFTNESAEEAAASTAKEEVEIEDVKIQTQDEEINTPVDPLHQYSSVKVLPSSLCLTTTYCVWHYSAL
ncbi:uncharacterized protein [Anabrus simplex]|uniref:uncharacterized protein isoform X2 n=1 Tax=Anabrus simplex TaxID=316456 RepID=UPI0035A38A58